MLNDTNKTANRKENKMKQYALVEIGYNEPNANSVSSFYFSTVDEVIGIYRTPERLKEAFDEVVEFGPIDDWGYNNDIHCTFCTSANYYAVEFEGEEEPDEEWFIEFASGRLDEYIDELDDEDKPKGDFKLVESSEEDPAFAEFKKVFESKKKLLFYRNSRTCD